MATINRGALAEAVSWVAGFIPSRPAAPILAGLKLHYQAGKIAIAAYDYEIAAGAAVSTETDGEPEWTVVVPGALFAQIIKGGGSREVTLNPSPTGLEWVMGRAKGVLHVLTLEEFPPLPDRTKAEPVVTVERAALQAKVSQAATLCGDSDWQMGVLLESNREGFWVRAGSRYAVQRSKLAAGISRLASYLLPHKQLIAALKMPGDTLEILADGDRVWFVSGDADDQRAIAMPTLTAHFPSVDALFDAERPIKFSIDGAELVEGLKSVGLVTNAVHLRGDEGRLTLSARTPFGGGELLSDVEVELETDGVGAFDAGMQLPYILGGLRGNGGIVKMEAMTTGTKSWLITEGNTETALMPLKGE